MKFLRCLGATAAFWVCMLIGPMLLLLVENISHLLTFGEWGENRGFIELIIYKVIQFLAQPIACYIGYEIAKKICTEQLKTCVMVNCVVAASLCGLFAICSLVAQNFVNAIVMAITAVVCIVCSVKALKD